MCRETLRFSNSQPQPRQLRGNPYVFQPPEPFLDGPRPALLPGVQELA